MNSEGKPDTNGKLIDRPWTVVKRKAAAESEKKKMQKIISASGLKKWDPVAKRNYWEWEMRKWVPDKVLGEELGNAELLTVQKEHGFEQFWDEQIFEALRLPNAVLDRRALQKKKEKMDPWMTSVKVIAKAMNLCLTWLEENDLVVKVEGRKGGEGGEWKGPLKKKLAGKIGLWQYVLELVHGPYEDLYEHPYTLLSKLGKTALFPKKLEAGQAHPLDGVWRRMLLG